jgi:asparagine synthetase B (glutamine-hydrolysing)
MCGIAGFVDEIGDGEKLLATMLNAIAHRGPMPVKHTSMRIYISDTIG